MKLVYSSWTDCDVIDFAFPQNFKIDAFAQGCPTFFDPRAIWAYQKYWRAKQIKHHNFRPKIVAISNKKVFNLNYSPIFSISSLVF